MKRHGQITALFILITLCFSVGAGARTISGATKPVFVDMKAKSGSSAKGTVRIRQKKEGLYIEGRIKKLKPGEHALHIHENPKCSDDAAQEAGGHWALKGQKHGRAGEKSSHIGDLGNITADEKGTAEFQFIRADLCLQSGQACSVLDRSLVVHAGPDDFSTQPGGDAGARVSCGVIDR